MIDFEARMDAMRDRKMTVSPVEGEDGLALVETGAPEDLVAFVIIYDGNDATTAVIASEKGDYTAMVVRTAGPVDEGDVPNSSSLRYRVARYAAKADLARGDEALAYGWPVSASPLGTSSYREVLESNIMVNTAPGTKSQSGVRTDRDSAVEAVSLYFSDDFEDGSADGADYEYELEVDWEDE